MKTIWNRWEHQSWGNNFFFRDAKKLEIAGWLTPLPKVGDEIRYESKSGICRAEITEIEYCLDPEDMFFAQLKSIGYIIKVNGKDKIIGHRERCPFCRKKLKAKYTGIHVSFPHLEKNHQEELLELLLGA